LSYTIQFIDGNNIGKMVVMTTLKHALIKGLQASQRGLIIVRSPVRVWEGPPLFKAFQVNRNSPS